MVNYNNVGGVEYARWNEDEGEPTVSGHEAKIDEMYRDEGHVRITMDTPDGYIELRIPILPTEDWDGFVESLPLDISERSVR